MIPAHWAFHGPTRRKLMRPTNLVFRDPNVAGGHIAVFRRLLRVGPFALYFGRYRPGSVPVEPYYDHAP